MSLLDWIYGTDALQKQSDTLTKQTMALNQSRVDSGVYDPSYMTIYNQHLTQNTPDTLGSDAVSVHDQITSEFNAGLAQGANNVSSGISGFFNAIVAPIKAVLKGLPWWIWVAGLLVLFLWLGGGKWLERKARSHFV